MVRRGVGVVVIFWGVGFIGGDHFLGVSEACLQYHAWKLGTKHQTRYLVDVTLCVFLGGIFPHNPPPRFSSPHCPLPSYQNGDHGTSGALSAPSVPW